MMMMIFVTLYLDYRQDPSLMEKAIVGPVLLTQNRYAHMPDHSWSEWPTCIARFCDNLCHTPVKDSFRNLTYYSVIYQIISNQFKPFHKWRLVHIPPINSDALPVYR